LRLGRFALYGLSAGGRLVLHYYAKHPDRVSCLVFYGTNPKATEVERQERHAVALSMIRTSWEFGSKLMAEALMPFGGAREDIDRIARFFRQAANSDVVQRLVELRQNRGDLRSLLSNVSVPTLVLHRRGDQVPFTGRRELASKIPGARFLPLEGVESSRVCVANSKDVCGS
jgi:pimeloyl-ACP methyl ester carboxylesterase